jgi:hypothetical protein
MDCAITAANAAGCTGTRQAIQYRDGLIICTLAMIQLRRGTLAALQIGRHLIKVGDHWDVDIPAADTKTRRPLDYSIPKDLSVRFDLYLEQFRSRIRGSDKHAGLWSSHHSIPMRPDFITCIVSGTPRQAFGPYMTRSTCEASRTFSVKPHLLRPRNTTSWRNRALRGVLSLGPSAVREKDSVFLILFRKFGEHHCESGGQEWRSSSDLKGAAWMAALDARLKMNRRRSSNTDSSSISASLRFIAQPRLHPAEPFQLERANGDYSAVEIAIRQALRERGEAHSCDVSILRARLGGRGRRERAGALEDRDSLAIQDIVPGGFGHRAFDHVTSAIQQKPHDDCTRFAASDRRIALEPL